MKFFASWVLLLCASSAWAANEFSSWRKVSSAEFFAEENAVAPGQKISLGFDVHLMNAWHTYWINPGDSGSAVKLTLSAKSGSKTFDILTGPIQFPIPERLVSGPITSFVYDREVMFIADAVIPESLTVGDDFRLHLEAEWLVCKDVCIPAFDSFDLNLPVRKAADINPSAHAESFLTWRGRLPRLETTPIAEKRDAVTAEFVFSKPRDFSTYRFADFFPLRGSFLSNGYSRLIQDSAKQVKIQSDVREVGERHNGQYGMLILKNGDKTVALQWGDPNYGFLAPEKPKMDTAAAPAVSILWLLVSAFLGGLILNLMPCVFPILSIKLLSLVKQSEQHPADVRAQNFAYVIGVILSFLLIGGALGVLRGTGELVGWGFQLQSPVFVLLLSWLFFLLALQMFGFFELEWLNPNWGGKMARKGGLMGSFFTGVLAVVVASPCTAPFMGAALGFGLSQPIGSLLSIFLMLGIGLAFPYLLFALFPTWARILPRPGAWMQTLKEFFGFPLLLTCVWLIWLLAQLRGNLAMGLALTGLVGWAFVIWAKTKSRWFATLCAIILVGGSLYILHILPEPAPESAKTDTLWTPFSQSALQRQGNETIFVDFTADWCLTCKLNERLVLGQSDIQQFLQKNSVRLVKGDWTKQDAEITKFLNNYRRAGVPFYIAFGPGAPEGRILPELLTTEVFKREMEAVLKAKGEAP